MRDVILDADVDRRLDELWADGQDVLVEAVEDAIDWIASGDRRAKAHRVDSPPLPGGFAWVVAIRSRGETWALVWSETSPRSAKVHAVERTEAF